MGSPISPIVANLCMEKLEAEALATAPHPPRVWYRYVDDTFVVIKKDHIDSLKTHINAIHPSIKFTSDDMVNNSLPFLDALVYLDDDRKIQLDIYRKPTHMDHYLNFDLHHPVHKKLGIVRTLFHRC